MFPIAEDLIDVLADRHAERYLRPHAHLNLPPPRRPRASRHAPQRSRALRRRAGRALITLGRRLSDEPPAPQPCPTGR